MTAPFCGWHDETAAGLAQSHSISFHSLFLAKLHLFQPRLEFVSHDRKDPRLVLTESDRFMLDLAIDLPITKLFNTFTEQVCYRG